MQQSNYVVYRHYATENGIEVTRYIGAGSYRRAINLYRRPKPYREWVAMHGRLSVEILHDGLTKAAAYAIEIELIAQHGRMCNGTGLLFNTSTGGPSGAGVPRVVTQEMRANMSAASVGKKCPHVADANHGRFGGKPQSPELIEKRAAALRGRKFSQEHKDALSAARRGKAAHNRGKPMSDEQKAKISATKRAKSFLTPAEADAAKKGRAA